MSSFFVLSAFWFFGCGWRFFSFEKVLNNESTTSEEFSNW